MTRKELERKLEQLGCLDWYSLDGSLCSDRRILYENYSVWEYFYMDERGNRIAFEIIYFGRKKPMITFIKRLQLVCMTFFIEIMALLTEMKYNHQSPYKEMISK